MYNPCLSILLILAVSVSNITAQKVETLPVDCEFYGYKAHGPKKICRVNFCSGNYYEIKSIIEDDYIPPVLSSIWDKKQKGCEFITKPYQVKHQYMPCQSTLNYSPDVKMWALGFEVLMSCDASIQCESLSMGNTHLSWKERPQPSWRRLCLGCKGSPWHVTGDRAPPAHTVLCGPF